jgi:hypothetical protein
MARARLARRRAGVVLVLAAAVAGCAGRSTRPALVLPAPQAILAAYASSSPVRMQAVQSVVMTWRHRPFTALGWFRCDREQGTFALVGLNPAGATLFSLSEAGGQSAGSFAVLPGGDPEAWTRAMAEDVRRIYFEGVPRPDDEVRASATGALVTRRMAGGLELRLSLAADPLRAEAEWYAGGRHVGTTISDDYEVLGTLRVPRHIVHRNRVYGYELAIRMKEIQSLEGRAPATESGTPRP